MSNSVNGMRYINLIGSVLYRKKCSKNDKSSDIRAHFLGPLFLLVARRSLLVGFCLSMPFEEVEHQLRITKSPGTLTSSVSLCVVSCCF